MSQTPDVPSPAEVEALARQARRDVLHMSFIAQTGHVPSALSMIDYLAVLFSEFVDPRRDRLILGKPFGAQAYYALFANLGWIRPAWHRYTTSDPEWQYIISDAHPLVTFIDDTIGNALSFACGVAHAFQGLVVVNVSDASFQAGTTWEAVQYAGAKRLRNLLLAIDNNHMQVLGPTDDIVTLEPVVDRLGACGWRTVRADGHDIAAMQATLRDLPSTEQPTALVFDTVKGQGVPFMVGDHGWHYRRLTPEDHARALEHLA